MVVSLLQRCGHKLTLYALYFQDTVVALQALSEFAKLVYSKDVNMRINVFTTKGQTPSTKIERYINRENNDILQYVDVSVQYFVLINSIGHNPDNINMLGTHGHNVHGPHSLCWPTISNPHQSNTILLVGSTWNQTDGSTWGQCVVK